MLRQIIIWILTSLLAKADPDFGKRLDEYKKSKVATEAKQKVDAAAIAADQATIAVDQVEQAAIEEQQQRLENEANDIAAQRRELRDDAEKNAPVRPSDDDLLSGPLPGSGSKGR